jgi:hypothetical protein
MIGVLPDAGGENASNLAGERQADSTVRPPPHPTIDSRLIPTREGLRVNEKVLKDRQNFRAKVEERIEKAGDEDWRLNVTEEALRSKSMKGRFQMRVLVSFRHFRGYQILGKEEESQVVKRAFRTKRPIVHKNAVLKHPKPVRKTRLPVSDPTPAPK